MELDITDEQALEMARRAILASSPMGLGYLHYKPEMKKEDLKVEISNGFLDIDYYEGRMVKFHLTKRNGKWTAPEGISADYQSWIRKYSSYSALADEVKNA